MGRQSIEQRQYRHSRSRKNARKTPTSDVDQEMPEHDLEPPKFARQALETLLSDWQAVKSMIMTGCSDKKGGVPKDGGAVYEDEAFLVRKLDWFSGCSLFTVI